MTKAQVQLEFTRMALEAEKRAAASTNNFEEGLEKGLEIKEEKLSFLIKNQLWSNEKEKEIDQISKQKFLTVYAHHDDYLKLDPLYEIFEK